MLTLSYYKGKVYFPALPRCKTYADALCSMGWAAALHLLWQGERTGPAYFCNLEGPLPTGGEFVEPCSVQDPSQDEVASPELPTVHEPLMIAPERLVVACISDSCSPPSFVNEVHIVASQLFLHGLVKSLDPWCNIPVFITIKGEC